MTVDEIEEMRQIATDYVCEWIDAWTEMDLVQLDATAKEPGEIRRALFDAAVRELPKGWIGGLAFIALSELVRWEHVIQYRRGDLEKSR